MRKVGDKARFVTEIDREFVDCSVSLTQDHNPMHTGGQFPNKPAVEAQLGIPKNKRIAHGMSIASLISAPLWELGGDGAILGEVKTMRFIKPVQIGDMITVEVEVIEERKCRLILAVRYRNQMDEDVIVPTEATLFVRDDSVPA